MRLLVQVRHGPTTHGATVTRLPGDDTLLQVDLDDVDSGLAPGQYAAFYVNYDNGASMCLGSGVIRERSAAELKSRL